MSAVATCSDSRYPVNPNDQAMRAARVPTTSSLLGLSSSVWDEFCAVSRIGPNATGLNGYAENMQMFFYGASLTDRRFNAKLFKRKLEIEQAAPIAHSESFIAKYSLADIQWIRDELSLSMSELAQLFGVTRKSVYDWFDGSNPRNHIAEKISAVKSFLVENVPGPYRKLIRQFWSKSNGDSDSLLKILQNEHPSNAQIKNGKQAYAILEPSIIAFIKNNRTNNGKYGAGKVSSDDIFRTL